MTFHIDLCDGSDFQVVNIRTDKSHIVKYPKKEKILSYDIKSKASIKKLAVFN